MNRDNPLEPGEQVDIDGDIVTHVNRRDWPKPDADRYVISTHADESIVATAADIRKIAELAGVIDSGIP